MPQKSTGLRPATPARAGLTRAQQAIVLAIAIGAFLFLQGPAWWEPYDYPRLWRQILGSYLPIPVLVAAMLWGRRRLTLRTFAVDTMILVVVKFVVSATIMVIAWSLTAPPREPLPSLVRPFTVRRGLAPHWTPPAATPLDRKTLARLEGVVVDAAGRPIEGALVRLVDDFPGISFAPRADTLSIVDDGTGPHPALSAVQVGQPLSLRSTDGRLHALRAQRRNGRIAFNQPMLAAASTHFPPRAWGELRLSCAAHGDREGTATLHVLSHPFFATTRAGGAFELNGVPAGGRVLAAQSDDATVLVTAVLAAGGTTHVRIQLR